MFSTSGRRIWLHGQKLHHLPHQGQPNATSGGRDRQSRQKFNIGLEAGSKPELHAVLAINTDENSLIICNGYKDENYVELALLAQKMGRRIFLVVEKLNELRLIADISKRLKIRPNIGIRIKLASSGSGKWEESGGDGSKFGLNSSELLEALDFLEKPR